MEEGKKPGRPAANGKMQERLDNLEACLSKMAHFTGQQRILDEFGIDRWELKQKDMKKYKE